MTRGRKGISGTGGIPAATGILIPLVFTAIYHWLLMEMNSPHYRKAIMGSYALNSYIRQLLIKNRTT
jgi:hypothetical protein